MAGLPKNAHVLIKADSQSQLIGVGQGGTPATPFFNPLK
jgi:hypothetical protein